MSSICWAPAMRREVRIERLGDQGDGIAELDEPGPVYIPHSLTGETVAAEIGPDGRGRLLEVLQPSPQRREPICTHFGLCGGCTLQHWEWHSYLGWKRQRVADALAMQGIDTDCVEPVRAFGPHSRRRATFTVTKTSDKLRLGFRQASSHDIIDLRQCPIMLPEMEKLLPDLRIFLAQIMADGDARLSLTRCANGVDMQIQPSKGRLKHFTPAHAAMAKTLGINRLMTHQDIIYSHVRPAIDFAGVRVELPAGAFLQASSEAESAIAELASNFFGKARKIADLFCGLGAFTFPLAKKGQVTAVEQDRTLLSALETAARHAQKLKPIVTLARDLMREPLSPQELKHFDGVLFDPPRAGAKAQASSLARSRVPKVVAVSCNPATFARDARLLSDGGFFIKRVVPIDQFVYSPHIELVAMFER